MDQLLVSSALAGSARPLDLSRPQGYYKTLRDLFAGRSLAKSSSLLRIPWSDSYLPAQAIKACVGFDNILPRSWHGLNLAELCQVALLWSLSAKPHFTEAAANLSSFLLPIIREELWTIWSRDEEYDAKETSLSVALLLRACGMESSLPRPEEPFFAYLFDQNLAIHCNKEKFEDPEVGYRLIGPFALTQSGNKIPAATGRFGPIRFYAIGPQFADLSQFGVSSSSSDRGWFQPTASKKTWLQLGIEGDEKGMTFSWQQVGIDPSRGLALGFYLSAKQVEIDSKVFKPKSLQKFSGDVFGARLQADESGADIRFDRQMRTELIPLAGEGCFWGASFLYSVHLPLFDTSFKFQLLPIAK